MLKAPFAHSRLKTLSVSTFACAILFSVPAIAQNQYQSGNQGRQQYQQQGGQQAGQANNGQTGQAQYVPKVTPQQLAAQQQAAQAAQPTKAELERRAAEYAAWQAQQAAAKAPPKALNMPEGFPLSAEHAEYVGKLLDFWETNSKKVEKYKCQFMRYSYDADVGYRDPKTKRLAAQTIALGEIRFATPDRARYETTRVTAFSKPPQVPGGEAEYKEVEGDEAVERWITDGKRIYEFDAPSKILYDSEIPKRLQGNVAESPLPFLFGVDKKELLNRYWVRYVAPPENVTDEYWLELFPKRIEDARNYKKIEVTIARADFLPKAMHLYSPQYDPAKGNESSQYFLFENRQVNSGLAKIADFFGGFVTPRLPRGWTRVDRATNNSQAAVPANAQQNGTRRQ
ncbi:MAG: hypothetical protein AB8B55_19365 [Mariniblastus sp.]